MTPKRIQLKRTKGWRMPPNTVKVDRTTKWGNPFSAKAYLEAGYKTDDPQAAVVRFHRAWLEGRLEFPAGNWPPVPDLAPLRGKNLACWCKPGSPCHADVLLELANRPLGLVE